MNYQCINISNLYTFTHVHTYAISLEKVELTKEAAKFTSSKLIYTRETEMCSEVRLKLCTAGIFLYFSSK